MELIARPPDQGIDPSRVLIACMRASGAPFTCQAGQKITGGGDKYLRHEEKERSNSVVACCAIPGTSSIMPARGEVEE